jgi:hypothetical protein
VRRLLCGSQLPPLEDPLVDIFDTFRGVIRVAVKAA